MVVKELEDLAQVVHVSLLVRASHQNIVKVDKGEGDAAEDAVHQSLEGLCCVLQPERHPEKLEKTEGSDDGGLGDILGSHRNIQVPVTACQI